MTIKELLDVFDKHRDGGRTIAVLDGNGEANAVFGTDSLLLEKIEDTEINSIAGDTIKLWLEETE